MKSWKKMTQFLE